MGPPKYYPEGSQRDTDALSSDKKISGLADALGVRLPAAEIYFRMGIGIKSRGPC